MTRREIGTWVAVLANTMLDALRTTKVALVLTEMEPIHE
jgi:hypothetical protein